MNALPGVTHPKTNDVARRRGTEAAKDLGIPGLFPKGDDAPSPGQLPRRSTRSGVVRRKPGRDAAHPVGKGVRGREKDCTGDTTGEGALLEHLSLRSRLVAAHRWSREASAAREAAVQHARWLVQLQRLDAPDALLDAGGRAMNGAAIVARTSSALAYTLLGREDMVAPEPDWPTPASVPDEDGVALALAIARDACVASTVLVATVRQSLRHARHPSVVTSLRAIALGADRRAAFAWPALTWLLESTVGSGSRAILGTALDAIYRERRASHEATLAPTLATARPRSSVGEADASPAHPSANGLGQLSAQERARIAIAALEQTVEPRFAALAVGPTR